VSLRAVRSRVSALAGCIADLPLVSPVGVRLIFSFAVDGRAGISFAVDGRAGIVKGFV
jgi:hypothetical protein